MVKYGGQIQTGGGLFDSLVPLAKPLLAAGAAATGHKELLPFIQLIPTGGGLADKYHKVHQFSPYEWEHIREAAKQSLLNGKPSNHWTRMGISGIDENVKPSAYLDIIAAHTPSHAGRILARGDQRAQEMGGALTDVIKKAGKWVSSQAERATKHSAKARALLNQHLPRLHALGKQAEAILQRAEQTASAVAQMAGEKKGAGFDPMAAYILP